MTESGLLFSKGGSLSVSSDRRRRRLASWDVRVSARPKRLPGAIVETAGAHRPAIDGKFLSVGGRRLHVCGVTYGTFAPDHHGRRFPPPDVVESDFAAMAAVGINAVRTYTEPPGWLLDSALRHGLWVMVGLPWEQHVAFLHERGRRRAIDDAGARADRAAAPAIRPCSATRSATRSRRRSYAGTAALRRAVPGAALRRGEGRGRRCTCHLRQLPQHRVPAAAVRRPCLVQRLPGRPRQRPPLPRPAPEPCRREAAVACRDGHRQPAPRRRAPGGGGRLADRRRRSPPAAPARSCSPGPTSGIAASDEVLDWDFGLTDRERRPKPALADAARRLRTAPGTAATTCRPSRWSSAPTTAPPRSARCLRRAVQTSTTPTTR